MSHLVKSLSNARRRSELISLSRGRADPAIMLGHASMFGYMADVGQRELLTAHQEQMKHYTGYTYAIIRTITNSIAGQPIHVGKFKEHANSKKKNRRALPGVRGFQQHLVPKSLQPYTENVDVVTDHPFLETLHRPNDLKAMGKFALVQLTFAFLELCGIGFWWIRFPKDERHPNGYEELSSPQIWPIPPSWVEPIHIVEDEYSKLFAFYKITPTGYATPFIVDGSEICMFMYPDPANPARPLSPMQALARTVFTDESVEESQRRHFLNSHNPGLAVIVGQMPGTEGIAAAAAPPALTKHQRAQLVDSLNEEWRNAVNYNNPIILDGLIKDVKKISNTPQEMDYMNSSDQAKHRLSECFGVSEVMLGQMLNANRASSVVAKEHFYDIVTNPRITMFSEGLTHQVAPLFADEGEDDLVAWIELCKATDIEFELLRDTSMVDRDCMTRNEWRAIHHMEPIEDGDMTISEWRTLRGLAFDPHITIQDEDDEAVGSEGPEAGEEKPRNEVAQTGKKISRLARQAERFHPNVIQKSWAQAIGYKEHARVHDKQARHIEVAFAKDLVKFFDGMGKHVVEQLRAGAQPGGVITTSAVDGALSDSQWDNDLRELVLEHVEKAAMRAALVEWNVMHPQAAPKGGYGTLLHKDFWSGLKNLPKVVITAVSDRVKSMAKHLKIGKIIESVRNKIKTVIQRSQEREEGREPPDALETVQRIEDEAFGRAASAQNAEVAAAINVNAGANAGADAVRGVLGKIGLCNCKIWASQHDTRVRPSHRDADGQTVGIWEKFVVGGAMCDYPGDLTLPADELFGCRCYCVSGKR